MEYLKNIFQNMCDACVKTGHVGYLESSPVLTVNTICTIISLVVVMLKATQINLWQTATRIQQHLSLSGKLNLFKSLSNDFYGFFNFIFILLCFLSKTVTMYTTAI